VFNGQFALRLGDKPEALRLFKLGAAECPPSYVERMAAHAELRALGGP
jgi:hypothetical protein